MVQTAGYVSKEQIARAKAVSILDYVLSHEPNNVKRVGNEHRLKDHSVTMSNGKWHWQSHSVGGEKATALNYLITVRGFGFVDAVRHLAGDSIRSYEIPQKSKPPPEHKPFSLPPRNRDNNRVIDYLQNRGIEKPLILDCIKSGSLYESANYHNCVFIGRDDNGKARFAALRGTRGDFKRDADGSDKCFGFVLPPKKPNCDTAAIFEAPIDCLSHQAMCEHGLIEPFDGWRLSLGGTALVALTNFLDRHKEVKSCIVCTDNDEAGNEAAEKIAELSGITVTRSPPMQGKDWNETLLSMRNEVNNLEDKRKDILFLSEPFTYPEKFRIKDGDSVKVTFAYDGEVDIQKCRFIDETHLTVGGSTYHISELAERLTKNGNKVEPIPDQKPMLNILAAKYGEALQGVEISMTDAAIRKLVGGKYSVEDIRGEHIMLRGKEGVAVCKSENGALTTVHPYWAQTLKRELGVIDPPPIQDTHAKKPSLLGKLESGKEKAAEHKAANAPGDSPKKLAAAELG